MNEIKAQFYVTLESGQFYERMSDTSTNAEWDEPLDVAKFDKLANGYRWSMATKRVGQRKFHSLSVSTLSLAALLQDVRYVLSTNPGAEVKCMTPDVEIVFENA